MEGIPDRSLPGGPYRDAGTVLLRLIDKKCRRNEPQVFDHERRVLDMIFRHIVESFRTQHLEAIQLCLQNGHFDTAELLLQGDTAGGLLQLASHILPLVMISSRHCHPASARSLCELFIGHGAPINGADEQRNTALYYACINGNLTTFRYLIWHGADLWTLHLSSSPKSEININLLEVTLDAASKDTSVYTFSADWPEIISYLVNAGLPLRPGCNSAINFVHRVCRFRQLKDSENILRLLFDHGIKPTHTDLYAAIMAGRESLVELLIGQGMNVRRKLRFRDAHDEPRMTVVEKILQRDLAPMTPERLRACELVVMRGGSSQSDARRLPEAAAKANDLDIVEHLLCQRFTLHSIPLCTHTAIVRRLIDAGIPMDPERLQKFAASNSAVELLKYLVGRDGLLVDWITAGATRHRFFKKSNLSLISYLVTESGLDVNEPLSGPNSTARDTNLLHMAVASYDDSAPSFHIDVVKLLLQAGADPDSPGLKNTVMEIVLDRITHKQPNISRFVNEYMPIIRLLLVHRAGKSEGYILTKVGGPIPYPPSSSDSGQDSGSYTDQGPSPKPIYPTIVDDAITPSIQSQVTSLLDQIPAESHLILSRQDGHPFTYDPLQYPDSIRLVKLEPWLHEEGIIHCSFMDCSLSMIPNYEVLSGYWGNNSPMEAFYINQYRFSISHELIYAMKKLRLKNSHRLLWVQAICINMNDIIEYNDQIGRLRDTLLSAQRLIVWLGGVKDGSDLVFEYIQQSEEYFRSSYYNTPYTVRDPFMTSDMDPKRCGSEASRLRPLPYKDHTLMAFRKLCLRPWFYRPWTIPEIAHSTNILILCGNASIGPANSTSTSSLSSTRNPFRWLFEGYRDLARTRPRQHRTSLLYDRMETLGDAVKHVFAVSVRDRAVRDEHGSMADAYRLTRRCRARDPRDYIFAIVGLDRVPLIAVDYRLSVSELFGRATAAIMQHRQSLHLLHRLAAREKRHDLLSWVVDFSSPLQVAGTLWTLYATRYAGIFSDLEAGNFWRRDFWTESPLPGLRFEAPDRLFVKGIFMESICATGPEMPVNVAIAHQQGSVTFSAVLQAWEALAVTQLPKARARLHPQAVTDAFLDTIAAVDEYGRRGAARHPAPRPRISRNCPASRTWYVKHGAGVLSRAEAEVVRNGGDNDEDDNEAADYFKLIEAAGAWVRKFCGDSLARDTLTNEVRVYSDMVADASAGRKFFITDQGSMGLCPTAGAAGDAIIFLPSGRYPFVVRRPGLGGGCDVLIRESFLYDWARHLVPVLDLRSQGSDLNPALTEFVFQ